VLILSIVSIGWLFLEIQKSKAHKLETQEPLTANQAIEHDRLKNSSSNVEKGDNSSSSVDQLEKYLNALAPENKSEELKKARSPSSVIDSTIPEKNDVDLRYALMKKTILKGTRITHPEDSGNQIISPEAYIFVCLNEISREEEFFQVSDKDFKGYRIRDFFSISSAKNWRKFTKMPTSKSLASEWVKTVNPQEYSQNSKQPNQQSKLIQQVEAKIDKMRRNNKKPSIALGLTSKKGKLKNPSELSPNGIGYTLAKREIGRYGTDEMVWGLMRSSAFMAEKLGTKNIHRVLIGDISVKDGGFLNGHKTQQQGVAVDIYLYRSDKDGKPIARGKKLKKRFDKNSYNETYDVYLDLKRNWLFLCSFIHQPILRKWH